MTPTREDLNLGRREQIGRRAFDRLRTQVAACLAAGGDAAVDPEAIEVASQLVWAAVHGLISLLIARPDFPWAERERLIATTVENTAATLGCAGRPESAKTAGGIAS
jgi:Tetracyclin repressor-like, C-terminal domain